jgi:16S rRNA (cytidine1402-2'-O)-methyltransferase
VQSKGIIFSMTHFPPGLYVVATPIGNLNDLSARASETLVAAEVVAAEDTRTSGVIVKRVGSKARLVSLTEHNVEARTPGLLEAAKTGVVALVSDAGTPVVADPGARLVEAAHEAGVAVFAVAGPSALAAAVSVSGMAGSDVYFLGFLPRKPGERRRRLTSAAAAASVLVLFESPNRIAATLEDIAATLGDPVVTVCRELTKLHEEVVRGRASELAERFTHPRGEFTIVVQTPEPETGDMTEVAEYLGEMKRAGAQRSLAVGEAVRRYGVARDQAYNAWPADGTS